MPFAPGGPVGPPRLVVLDVRDEPELIIHHPHKEAPMAKLRALWANLPSPIKSGVMVLVWTFIATFSTLSIEFLQAVATWLPSLLDESDAVVEVPNVGALADALLSAGVAFIAGLVALIGRTIQAKTSLIPGQPPQYNPPPQ